jgi:predicted phosphodiesterase
MKWFHFSDFHIGRPKGPQSLAVGSLIDAVEKATAEFNTGKIDFVFITGDIAYSGQQDQYAIFLKEFLKPLLALEAFTEAKVVAVPGNHDVDCDLSIPISWFTIGKRNQLAFFCEDESGLKAREQRALTFRAYEDFVKQNGIISPHPSCEVSLLISDESYPFDLLATNTAFFADHEQNSDAEITPSPIASIQARVSGRSVRKPILLLAHHPVTCFIRDHQTPITTLLKEKKVVLLHGHEHNPRVTFNPDGTIRTVGFGASYLGAQQLQTAPPYQNTFTYCRLEEKLIIRAFTWQPQTGKWVDTTGITLADCIQDDSLKCDEVAVAFPSLSNYSLGRAPDALIRTVHRVAPKPLRLLPIDAPGDDLVNRLFRLSSNIRSVFQKGEPTISKVGKSDNVYEHRNIRIEFEVKNGQRHLLLLILVPNHILSSKEVEAINTELDTVGFITATIISIGRISGDAQTLYLRLRERKPIEVIVGDDLIGGTDYLLSDQQRVHLARLDAAKHSISLLFGTDDLYMLVVHEDEEGTPFYVVDGNGDSLQPTDPFVARVRRVDPQLANLPYLGNAIAPEKQIQQRFDEMDYLAKCHSEYRVIRYAALANIGIRLSELPLDELYVNASASDISDRGDIRSERFVDDHLASYFSEEMKERIQQQLLAQAKDKERKEASRALEYCQQYPAVLITGDPGSGKTCFVKNEILSYCKRAIVSPSVENSSEFCWHSNHIPILVALSEAVAEKDLEEVGLLRVASRVLERRGLYFPEEEIRGQALQGRIAFFFDGLDEVVSVEKRAQIVKHINDLVVEFLPAGNRVVVTSRPAAVQVVNLMPTLHRLELQGLTEAEISMLAGRLLAFRVFGTSNNVVIGEGEVRESDNIVIAKLVSDCRKNSGVLRMAQNPLLLTLLTMIYANAGAPSAKRHKIYEEAIKTLASVRGREAGHQPIPVQDLRERLGAIALSVYQRESGLLPIRSEVTEIVRKVMERQYGAEVSVSEANSYIQRVAESTGLIAMEHRYGQGDGHAIVTFMHHSFLEYFAAVGLSRELSRADIKMLVNEPRWREILTLLAGIIGENEDISPTIRRFLECRSAGHDVDARVLLFAIDCAMECEVPSEAAQRLLAAHIKECLTEGAGRLDPWVRTEIGTRLNVLVEVCGGSEFDSMLADLIRSDDEAVSAAAVEVAGYACEGDRETAVIAAAFEEACTRFEDAVLSAICGAASRSRILRTAAATQVIGRCLKKSRRNQQAAYEALAKVPTLASRHWDEIIESIDDSNARTSKLASVAAMNAGLNVDVISLGAAKKDVLIRALDNVAKISRRDEYRHLGVRRETISELHGSPRLQDKLLGIRLLPLVEGDEAYIYETLIRPVRRKQPEREELVASLVALRWSGSVLALIKVEDVRAIAGWMKEGTADVRTAATQLLAFFGGDRPVIDALLADNFDELDVDDYCERMLALGRASTDVDRVKEVVFAELGKYLRSTKKMTSENVRKVRTLLESMSKLAQTAPTGLATKVRELIDDFRIEESIKKKALLCYPAIAEPCRKTVERISELFVRPPANLDVELVQVPALLARKCRSSVDYVVASVSALSELRGTLVETHARYAKRQDTELNEYYVTELRRGITDISEIVVAFKDFISQRLEGIVGDRQKAPVKAGME